MNAMTLISRRSATHEDFGRDKTYRQPVAQWTDYERRCNRIVEDLMILDAAKHKKRKAEVEAWKVSNEERRAQFWQPILDVMDGPMTSQQIAPLVGRQVSPVANSLKAMEKAGLVSRKDQGRDKNGRQLPMIWSRIEAQKKTPKHTERAQQSRMIVLAAMDKPTTAASLSRKTDMSRSKIDDVILNLRKQGLIVKVREAAGSAPALWVRA